MTIKYLREAKGITQRQMALKLKIQPQMLSRIETHDENIPPKHFKRASKILGVPVHYLLKMSMSRYESRLKERMK